MPPEGNVFKPIDIRGYVLLLKLRELADAAMAVVRVLVAWETAVDDAFAIQTCDVCDAGNRRAVRADGRVRRERNSASTTFFLQHSGNTQRERDSQYYGNKHAECERWVRQTRTTFEITSGVDTFPCTGTTAIHAAGRPPRSLF